MQKLTTYLQSIQSIINLSELERLAGCPGKTIHNAVAGHQPLPKKWAGPIIRVLCGFFGNITVAGQTISVDEVPTIYFVSMPIPEREIESKEVSEGTSVHFEYLVPQYRDVCDEFDLITNYL